MKIKDVYSDYDEKVEELFSKDDKYSFLIGAGVSMNPPTSLPSALEIGSTLVELCAPKSEIKTILSLQSLRFEGIVEQVQKFFDKDLKFMDYFDVITIPNLIHIFLAQSIIEGHDVITTNFDYMIERALMQLLPEEQHQLIVPVIIKSDFMKYGNLQEEFSASGGHTKAYMLYKLHGSKRNIIQDTNTIDSLVTTISALGREREKGETFAIEAYKKPAINKLMKDRTLIVMGYSGSDDFDIGPALKELQFLKRLIWLEHSRDAKIKISRVKQVKTLDDIEGLLRTDKLLAEIRSDVDFEVLKVQADTLKLVNDILIKQILIETKLMVTQEKKEQVAKFRDWAPIYFKDIPKIEKHKFAGKIFHDMGSNINAEQCLKNGLKIAENNDDISSKEFFINELGLIYKKKGENEKALDIYQILLKDYEQKGILTGKAIVLNNIGKIYRELWGLSLMNIRQQHKIIQALSLKQTDDHFWNIAYNHYKQAKDIAEKLDDPKIKIITANNLAEIYSEHNQVDMARKIYEEIWDITGQIEDISEIALFYKNLGKCLRAVNQYDKAITSFNYAIEWVDKIGDLQEKARLLYHIGTIHILQMEYDEALKSLHEAFAIAELLGDKFNKAEFLMGIGEVYRDKEDYDRALSNYNAALKIDEKLGDLQGKYLRLTCIKQVYNKKMDYYKVMGDKSNAKKLSKKIQMLDKELAKLEKDEFTLQGVMNKELDKLKDLFKK